MRWRALAAFGSSALLLAGCGAGSKPSIVLYNGQHPELTTAMVSAFQRASGIAVGDRTNDGVVLADQILEEGGSSPADVYLTENSPELVDLSEHGLLARLPSSILDQVPAGDRSSNGTWVGVALRVNTLVYNPARISRSQLPSSILDLAEPKWKGKVAIAPLDSDFPPVVGAVIATHGRKAAASWLAGLKRNGAIYQDEESVVAAVLTNVVECFEKHAPSTACRVVDGLPSLRVEDVHHEANDGPRCVELTCFLVGEVGELFDEVFVGLAENIPRCRLIAKIDGGEMLNEVAKQRIRQPILVGPLRIAKDAIELVRVGLLNGPHSRLQRLADIVGGLPHLEPVRVLRNLEAVILRVRSESLIPAGLLQR